MQSKDWEQAVKDAYGDYRWRKIMEPLCETFQRWKAGEIGHAEVDAAIDHAYKERCAINTLLAQRQDRAAGLIRCRDPEWFKAWVEEHHPGLEIDGQPC